MLVSSLLQIEPSLVQVTFLTVFGLVVIALRRRYLSSLSNIPGPFWASITRLWHAYHIFNGDHNTVSIALHEKYGYFVRIAPNEVSVSHPDGPNILLRALLRKGDWYRVFAVPDYRFTTPQSVLDPVEKIRRSKFFASGFSLSNLLKAEERFDENIQHLLNWMDKYSQTGEAMHLDRFFSYVAFDNAGEAVFSRSFDFISQGRDVLGSIQNSRSLNSYLAIAGYYVWLHRLFVANPVITWSRLLPMGHLWKTSDSILETRKSDPDARFDIVAHWFNEQRLNPKELSVRDVQAQAMTSVVAGSDTLSCALQSFVYHMIQNPKSWERARAEIKSSQAQGHCKTRVITYEDSRKLPYLEACIYEALRMFGPGPFGFPRVAPAGGITIGESFFAEGTVLSINPQVMQQSESCWGSDAKQWNPDRWFKEGMQSKYKHWLVFGLGYNRCPGEHLAELQLFKIAACLVRDYSIYQINPENKWKWKADFTVVPHSWPVYVSKKEYEI